MNQNWFKLYNAVFDMNLTPMQLMVYAGICAHANRFGMAIIKYETISKRCGCSAKSAKTAVSGLCDIGLIHKAHRYSKDGHYIANAYRLAQFTGGWLKVNQSVFSLGLGKTAFAVFLFLSRCANNCNAFPSCSKIANSANISLPSVRKAVKLLVVSLGVIDKCRQWRKCGCYGCNRYIVLKGQKERIHATCIVACIQKTIDCEYQSKFIVTRIMENVKFFYSGVGKFLHNKNKTHLGYVAIKRKNKKNLVYTYHTRKVEKQEYSDTG